MLSQEYRGASSYYERTAMKVDGGCPCESIRYTAEIEEDRVIICHCTDCRTLSGSAFPVVVQTVPGSFQLLSGEPRIYTKVAESGVARKKGVCPECGTPVFSRPSGGHTSALGLRVGTITQRDELFPKDRYWYRSSQGWLDGLGDIHSRETQPTFRAGGTIDE